MTLDKVKKIFRYGWIAKDEDENWSWSSEKPVLYRTKIGGCFWQIEDGKAVEEIK